MACGEVLYPSKLAVSESKAGLLADREVRAAPLAPDPVFVSARIPRSFSTAAPFASEAAAAARVLCEGAIGISLVDLVLDNEVCETEVGRAGTGGMLELEGDEAEAAPAPAPARAAGRELVEAENQDFFLLRFLSAAEVEAKLVIEESETFLLGEVRLALRCRRPSKGC